MQESDLPSLPFTGRDEASIKAALIAFVQATYASVQSDFTEATLGMMLIDVVSQEGGLESYGQDAAASEFYLSTCRRRESGVRWANSVGYAVTSAQAAELTVKSVSVPNALIINGGTFPALTTFLTTASGLRFELQEDLVVPTGIAIIRMDLLEGQTFTETFNPANVPNQIITGSQAIVQDGSWSIYVGDPTNPANLWTQVANVTLEPSADDTYDVTIDGSGRVNIRFGDGVAGAIPGATITLTYRTTDGAAGNIPAGALQGSLNCTLNSSAGVASVPFENYDLQADGSIVGAATGGAAQESLQQLKTNIPAYIRAPVSIVTLPDYDSSLLRLSVVALTATQRWISSYTGNIVRINAWSEVNTEFTATCTAPALTATVPYTEYTQLQPTAAATIQAFLTPLTMLTVHNVITSPTMLWLDLFLGTVTYDPTYAPAQVLTNITTAIVNLFETGSGFALYLSELYNAVRNTAGVQFFNLQRISTGYQDSSAEAQGSTAASATQSGALQVTPVLGGTVTITFQQTAGNIIVQDDGDGHFVIAPGSASATISSSSFNYQTGLWTILFGAALQGGQGILADYQDLVDDYRLQQIPVTDPWPAPQGAYIRVIEQDGLTVASATQSGTFANNPAVAGQVMLSFTTNVGAFVLLDDGAGNLVLSVAPAGYTLASGTVTYSSGAWTFTLNSALGAGYAITASYRQSGFYPPLQDIVINAGLGHVPYYYDDTLMFNNEVFYDSVVSNLNPDLLALNLRTLSLNLVAGVSS